MGSFVCNGAFMQCTFGTLPIGLIVADPTRPKICNLPLANVMDYVPMTNITSFGLCTSISNPAVTPVMPAPCVPVVNAPWSPGAQNFKVANFAALTNNSKCNCVYSGVISIVSPGNSSPATVE